MEILPLAVNGNNAMDVAVRAAKGAGEILLKHFDTQKTVTHKSHGNLVTDVDKASEQFVLDFLASQYPDHSVLSEETHSDTSVEGYTWIVDPLDGTNNYVFGIPFFCANVALAHNGAIVLGVTYDPIRDELFTAQKNGGAYLNAKKIHVTQVTQFEHAAVGFDLGYSHDRGQEILSIATKLWGNVHCLRAMGSAALGLAYVAAGRFGLYFHRCLFPWDIASGTLLIAEAGGRVIDWEGKPALYSSQALIASNESLIRSFLKLADV